jgi:protocatechuate 3,4-dioxygenase beta subunit
MPMKSKIRDLIVSLLLTLATAWGQNQITGTVLDDRGQIVPNAEITIGQSKTKADAEGRFSLPDLPGPITIRITGNYIATEQTGIWF